MKRVYVVAAVLLCALLGAGRAEAAVELCPAAASAMHPLDGDAKAATTFGFDLDALSAETVSGTIAVETDKGWFEVPFGPTAVAKLVEDYSDPAISFRAANYASGAIYARFPGPVEVKRAFVLRISTDDTVFQWPSKGGISCEFEHDFGQRHEGRDGWPRRAELFTLPTGASPIAAAPSSAFSNLPCAKPFVQASVTTAIPPNFPLIARESGNATVIEAVELDAHGSVIATWFVTPPSMDLDRAADIAARRSAYAPAISFCRPVPSVSRFQATFQVQGV